MPSCPSIKNPNDQLVSKLAEVMEKQFGMKRNRSRSYSMPYPEWYNRLELPHNYRILELSKFTGEDRTSTMKHISRYLAQLGDATVEEIHKVRFFALSLSGPAFTWYSSLSSNSINSWDDLESKFHAYFFNGTIEKDIDDLTSMKMRNNESGLEFIQRFRQMKSL